MVITIIIIIMIAPTPTLAIFEPVVLLLYEEDPRPPAPRTKALPPLPPLGRNYCHKSRPRVCVNHTVVMLLFPRIHHLGESGHKVLARDVYFCSSTRCIQEPIWILFPPSTFHHHLSLHTPSSSHCIVHRIHQEEKTTCDE